MKCSYTLQLLAPRESFSDFVLRNGLDLVVRERSKESRARGLERFLASFKGSEIKRGATLMSQYGNGNTPEEAIGEYANLIRGEVLVINAYKPDYRREVQCPSEWIEEG